MLDSWQGISLDEILEQNGRPYAIFLKDTLNIDNGDNKDVRFVFVYLEGGLKKHNKNEELKMSKEEIARFKLRLSDQNMTRDLFRQDQPFSESSRLKWKTYEFEIDKFMKVRSVGWSNLCL
jgi:hypothetical protein